MRANEILAEGYSEVVVNDGEKDYTYFVKPVKPEVAKRAALKKHRRMYGLGQVIKGKAFADKELSARIVNVKRGDSGLGWKSD